MAQISTDKWGCGFGLPLQGVRGYAAGRFILITVLLIFSTNCLALRAACCFATFFCPRITRIYRIIALRAAVACATMGCPQILASKRHSRATQINGDAGLRFPFQGVRGYAVGRLLAQLFLSTDDTDGRRLTGYCSLGIAGLGPPFRGLGGECRRRLLRHYLLIHR